MWHCAGTGEWMRMIQRLRLLSPYRVSFGRDWTQGVEGECGCYYGGKLEMCPLWHCFNWVHYCLDIWHFLFLSQMPLWLFATVQLSDDLLIECSDNLSGVPLNSFRSVSTQCFEMYSIIHELHSSKPIPTWHVGEFLYYQCCGLWFCSQ